MDDRGTVAALCSGDPNQVAAGMAGAYDAYANPLYAYCLTMVRDRDSAYDALHDTFVVASQRAAQLRDPDRLRPWLYAIARNECLRQLRGRSRHTALDEAADVIDETVSLDADLRAAELRTLVWQAAEGLNDKERQVIELSVRGGLEGRDLADALGVSGNHANALLSRARDQLERSLAALIVARTGAGDCPELAEMVSGWDGTLTVLMRKRLARHIDRCATCGQRRHREVSATALLSAIPFAVAPVGLKERLASGLGDVELVGSYEAIGGRAGTFDREGFPRPADRGSRLFPLLAGAAGLALLGGLLVPPLLNDADDPGPVVAAPTTSPSPLFTTPVEASQTASATPTQSPTPTATATVRVTPTRTARPDSPTGTPTPTPAGRLVIDPVEIRIPSFASSATVELSAKGGPVSWTAAPQQAVLTVDPSSGSLPADGPPQTVQILLDRGKATSAGSGSVVFSHEGGQITVHVTWEPYRTIG